jgi:hypothetical protein
MKTLLFLITGLIMAHAHVSMGQKTTHIDVQRSTPLHGTATFDKDIVHLVSTSGTAILWLDDVTFANGTLELDLKGNDVRGESFLGIAFHGLNDSTYCAVYFRPFNFRIPDRNDHSVQFIDLPGNDWDVLREKFPGQYENTVTPVPDPNDWFHARIVIAFPEINVFVNGAQAASLTVRQISGRKDGKLGLWIDSKDGWFRGLKISRQ